MNSKCARTWSIMIDCVKKLWPFNEGVQLIISKVPTLIDLCMYKFDVKIILTTTRFPWIHFLCKVEISQTAFVYYVFMYWIHLNT